MKKSFLFFMFGALLLSACGGGSSDSSGGGPETAANPTLTFTASRIFHVSWTDVNDATHYKLLENPDGASGFTQVGNDIAQGKETFDYSVPWFTRINARYILQSCNTDGCTDSASVAVSSLVLPSVVYSKASNSQLQDAFGLAVSLSSDGNTLAVGVSGEDSSATGINGNQNNNAAQGAGAVYVFNNTGGTWAQQAYIKASNTGQQDAFGVSVSLSRDGNTLAVGASDEDSNATGIGGNQSSNTTQNAGAAYVFVRNAGNWSQQAYIKASNTGINDFFGIVVSLSSDGDTLAVGASGESSSATGIGGDQNNNAAQDAGAAYVFTRNASNWSQQAYIKASNTGINDVFGIAVNLSGDSNTLVVGAFGEDSSATGIGGSQGDNSATDAGAAYVFVRNAGNWSQQAYIKASNTGPRDSFGVSISLSVDGSTLAVGATAEDSNATGVGNDQSNNAATQAGAVYVFNRGNGTNWQQQAYIKASNTAPGDAFGVAVSLSGDGDTLAVGATDEDGSDTGIDGNQSSDAALQAGVVYIFNHSAGNWVQGAYIKASNTGAGDLFGRTVSLNENGNILAAGAPDEDSNAVGVNGDQRNNLATNAGAVYLY